MKKADPIPVGMISIPDAFDIVYQTITPHRQILEERLNPSSPHYDRLHEQDAKCAYQEAWRSYDQFRRCAREWLGERISEGTLVAQVRDPKTGELLQIDRDEWASMGDFESMDVFETGIAIVKGERRRVFFDRKNFDNLVKKIAEPTITIAKPTVIDKGGRPSEYNWDAIKAFTFQKIKEFGRPHRNNKRLPSKAQLIELIQKELSDRYDQHPTASAIRYHLDQWLPEFERKLAETGFR